MERKKFKCVICGKTIEYNKYLGSPPIIMHLKLKNFNVLGNVYFINERFKVCFRCHTESFFCKNTNILEHAKKLIENRISVMKRDERKECDKCNLYGECDHLGAYKKDGKWCYETSGDKTK